ncbi:MAG: hypothetical protein WDM89_13350 [Rhizomicrobium sp.]
MNKLHPAATITISSDDDGRQNLNEVSPSVARILDKPQASAPVIVPVLDDDAQKPSEPQLSIAPISTGSKGNLEQQIDEVQPSLSNATIAADNIAQKSDQIPLTVLTAAVPDEKGVQKADGNIAPALPVAPSKGDNAQKLDVGQPAAPVLAAPDKGQEQPVHEVQDFSPGAAAPIGAELQKSNESRFAVPVTGLSSEDSVLKADDISATLPRSATSGSDDAKNLNQIQPAIAQGLEKPHTLATTAASSHADDTQNLIEADLSAAPVSAASDEDRKQQVDETRNSPVSAATPTGNVAQKSNENPTIESPLAAQARTMRRKRPTS